MAQYVYDYSVVHDPTQIEEYGIREVFGTLENVESDIRQLFEKHGHALNIGDCFEIKTKVTPRMPW